MGARKGTTAADVPDAGFASPEQQPVHLRLALGKPQRVEHGIRTVWCGVHIPVKGFFYINVLFY